MRRLRRPRAGTRRRPPLVFRPLCAPASRPGVGGDRGQRRRATDRAARPRPRAAGVRRAEPLRPARRPRDRPHALLHDRRQRLGERAAASAPRARSHRGARPQRQPRQPRGAARARRQAARVVVRLGGDRGADRRRRAAARQRRSPRRWRCSKVRRPSSGSPTGSSSRSATDSAFARSCSAGSATTRSSRRSHARSISSARGSSARCGRASSSIADERRAAFDPGDRAGRARSALHLRVLLPRAPRHPPLGRRGARRPRADGRAARAGVAGRSRPRAADPGLGHTGRDRLRARREHPVQRRADQEPLRRPHVHPARAGHARAGDPHEVQPARRGEWEAARRGRRLDRARLDDAPDRADALRRGRGRGARADLVSAGRLALLLRDRSRVGGRDDRRRTRRSRR